LLQQACGSGAEVRGGGSLGGAPRVLQNFEWHEREWEREKAALLEKLLDTQRGKDVRVEHIFAVLGRRAAVPSDGMGSCSLKLALFVERCGAEREAWLTAGGNT
jgi:hypothetical protein